MNTAVFLHLSRIPRALYTTFCELLARTLEVSHALAF